MDAKIVEVIGIDNISIGMHIHYTSPLQADIYAVDNYKGAYVQSVNGTTADSAMGVILNVNSENEIIIEDAVDIRIKRVIVTSTETVRVDDKGVRLMLTGISKRWTNREFELFTNVKGAGFSLVLLGFY